MRLAWLLLVRSAEEMQETCYLNTRMQECGWTWSSFRLEVYMVECAIASLQAGHAWLALPFRPVKRSNFGETGKEIYVWRSLTRPWNVSFPYHSYESDQVLMCKSVTPAQMNHKFSSRAVVVKESIS